MRKALLNMANETPGGVSSSSESLNSATKFLPLAAELFKEVQQHVGHSKIRSLRLTLGGRPIRDFPVSPATAAATIILVVVAVIITNLRVEVVKDTDDGSEADKAASSGPSPGGRK